MDRRFARIASSNAGAKAKVLCVDDHAQVLDTVSAMLADGFDVAVASGGRQALDMAPGVAPDVVVLDIEMPQLHGFQVARALRQAGLSAPIVFMSMHHTLEYVSEAFRCGGIGYVSKSRLGRDLSPAIDQALLGRSFVPSLSALFELADGGLHAMKLHGGVESLLDELAAVFDLSLRRGDATCVIATEAVREGLTDRLQARGWDVNGSSARKRYLVIDAAVALSRFMRNGLPDADRLAGIAAELDHYRLEVAEGAKPRLTIFGNMVGLLGADGNANAIIALESRWNTLTRNLPFLTVCGYATSCFHDDMPTLWEDVCAEHRAMTYASDV